MWYYVEFCGIKGLYLVSGEDVQQLQRLCLHALLLCVWPMQLIYIRPIRTCERSLTFAAGKTQQFVASHPNLGLILIFRQQ